MLRKKFLIIAIAVVIIIVVAGVWLGIRLFAGSNPAGPSPYSAVYMATGDIYFGKLSWFPWPTLHDVWFLQRGIDPQSQQAQFGIAPLTSAFWGPVDEIKLNPEQIVFIARLRNDSQVAQAFANPSAFNQTQAAAPAAGGTPATGGFQGPTGPPPSGQ